MGQIKVVLIFNEDDERQREAGEYLKTKKRCKTALVTELVQAWDEEWRSRNRNIHRSSEHRRYQKTVTSRQGVFVRNRKINGRNELSRSRVNRARR